jgi:hypothetical protein
MRIKRLIEQIFVYFVLGWLLAWILLSCQNQFGFAPGQTHICPSGYHWVVDSAGIKQTCVKNG